MVQRTAEALAELYETDETAWLDRTAELVRAGRFDQLDGGSLAEYLADMAKRDRREVMSRLVVLLTYLLKWDRQPEHRSNSWRGTILEQQRGLRQLLDSGRLLNHAHAVFDDAYSDARLQAAAESGLARGAFPEASPWDLSGALSALVEEIG